MTRKRCRPRPTQSTPCPVDFCQLFFISFALLLPPSSCSSPRSNSRKLLLVDRCNLNYELTPSEKNKSTTQDFSGTEFLQQFLFSSVALGNKSGSGGALVLPVGRELAVSAVVASEAVNTRLDQNESELGVLVTTVTLQVLAHRNRLFDEHVQVLRYLSGKACSFRRWGGGDGYGGCRKGCAIFHRMLVLYVRGFCTSRLAASQNTLITIDGTCHVDATARAGCACQGLMRTLSTMRREIIHY